MPAPRFSGQACGWRRAAFGIVAALLLASAATAADLDPLVETGRRIYVDGILPDGTPLKAIRFDGVSTVAGAEAACVNCHRPSGYGSIEGRILVPPVAGAVLFAPGVFAPAAGGRSAPVRAIERFRTRSAYDEQKLQRALRAGIDPDGKPLQPLMARYDLDTPAVKALAAYLRRLSAGPAPGVAGETLHLGTVITPDVPPQQREALLEVLRAYAAMRKWQLHVWQLTGAPREWDAQLDELYRRQPVFALLSGAGAAEWQPVHRFCERHAVACVLPSVELAPEAGRDSHSLYFSSGLSLEAQLLAHELAAGAAPPRELFQVVEDDSGDRAAKLLERALEQAGSRIAVRRLTTRQYAGMAPLPAQSAMVWWLRPEQIAGLIAAAPGVPPSMQLYLSALLAPPEELAIPDDWKRSLRYVSVYDPLAALRTQASLRPWLKRQGISETNLRMRADAYAACNFFNNAVTAMQLQSVRGISGPLGRERLIETLENELTLFRDDSAPYYWQLGSGPGQHLLVKGGMLLRQAGPGDAEWEACTARIVP